MPTRYRTIDPHFVIDVMGDRLVAAGEIDEPSSTLDMVHLELTTATPYLAQMNRPRRLIFHADRDALITIAFALDGDADRMAALIGECPRRLRRLLKDAILFVSKLPDDAILKWTRINDNPSEAVATRH